MFAIIENMKNKRWTPERIKELRHALSMPQREFASLLRVTPQYVGYLERGVRSPSGPLMALLDYLEKDLKIEEKKKKRRGCE